MELGTQGNYVLIQEMLVILQKIKNKYWKLGRSVALTPIPDEIKSQFYSLGNDMDKFLSLAKKIGVEDAKAT